MRPPVERSLHAQQPIPLRTAFGAEAGATLGLAGLLEELPAAHLLLDAAALDQLAEAANRLLNALPFANRELDHASPNTIRKTNPTVSGGAGLSREPQSIGFWRGFVHSGYSAGLVSFWRL